MKDRNNIILLLLIAGLFLFPNLFCEEPEKSELIKFTGTLKQIVDDWYLNTGEDFLKLDLAPAEYLEELGLVLLPKNEIILEGLLADEVIVVYTVFNEENEYHLRNSEGNQLWEEPTGIGRQYYVVDPAKCISCQLCIKYCPVNAIKMHKGKAVIDPEKCIACGICSQGNQSNFKGCPVGAISKTE